MKSTIIDKYWLYFFILFGLAGICCGIIISDVFLQEDCSIENMKGWAKGYEKGVIHSCISYAQNKENCIYEMNNMNIAKAYLSYKK